eukprot:scaffold1867_cov247-Pinguiococcus_pyrenoidosus.AAC.7
MTLSKLLKSRFLNLSISRPSPWTMLRSEKKEKNLQAQLLLIAGLRVSVSGNGLLSLIVRPADEVPLSSFPKKTDAGGTGQIRGTVRARRSSRSRGPPLSESK